MRKALAVIGLALGCAAYSHAAPLLRYPTASTTKVGFVAHGDLWTTSLQGGLAQRLTHNAGVVTTPLFSPDGHWIAYTSRQDGLHDVFVVLAEGGEPRRLTHEASSFADGDLVVAWTPDSKRVVFLSHRGSPVSKLVRAFSVSVKGGPAEQLPLDRAGMISFAPGGRTIAYNRVFRNLELRKRYIGGQAQSIYTYNFDSRALSRITDWKGTNTAPMWFKKKLYFLSDRGSNFRENIWSFDFVSRSFRQITNFLDYDIDWPSLGGSTITFQQGGHLFAIDLPSEQLREIKVDVPNEDERTRPRSVMVGQFVRFTDVMGGVDYSISPQGESLIVSARGDLFCLRPNSQAQNLTNTPGVDEDHPSWSPDGQLIVYETDSDGEQQLALRSAQGGPERLLTHFLTGYLYSPTWSPLGDSLAVADANHSLWWVHLDGSVPQRIAFDPLAEIRDAAFSPDGRWLAYSTQRPTKLRAIHLYELSTGQDTVVSSLMENDRAPVFTSDGQFLVFVSQRNEQPFVSDRGDESLVSTLNSDGLYAVALDARPPHLRDDRSAGAPAGNAAVRVDLEGFMSRAVALPITPGVIESLEARPTGLFYQTNPVQLLDGDLAGARSALHVLDLAVLKDRVVLEGLDNFSVSADGMTVAFHRDGVLAVTSTAAEKPVGLTSLNLANLVATVDPLREWTEMFENAWRLDRDVFFSKGMNGSDWQAVHDAYVRFLPRLGSQDDFLYLLGQMQGEIASSHTFLAAGIDADAREPVRTGLLGADYALDAASNRYRFAHIYTGDQTRLAMRGPLGVPGLAIKPGDYLMAVNGRELVAPKDPDSLLAGQTKEVTLTVALSATGARREVKVTPLVDDTAVRRYDWIEDNRKKVDRLSRGRLGYIFLTDFNAEGSKDFVRQFYPQRDKEGLVFDVRWNRGGFTSQAVLDVLRREHAGIFVNREGSVSPLPGATAPSMMVALINYASASDGDQFAFFFRKFGLGKLVGERTWGGVQGINGPWKLMDGSSITIPKDSLASLDAHWIIENEGVTPDISVEPPPGEAITHRDLELEVAIKVALEQCDQYPMLVPHAPAETPAYPPGGDVPGAAFTKQF
jgi:tricorn protease